MNPNSRSPWAAWFRFMKSMSISPQGRSRLNWVWRWSSGLWSAWRPAIHIRAGENVCIHRMTPTQLSTALASSSVAVMLSGVVTTGRWTILTGIASAASRASPTMAGVDGHLAQRRLAVHVLAAGDEPDLEDAEWLHCDLPEPAIQTLHPASNPP